MNKIKLLGLILVLTSIGLTIPNMKITGAVIGSSTSSFLGILAMVSFFVGSALLLSREKGEVVRTIDKLVQEGTPRETIQKISPVIRKKFKNRKKNERKEIYGDISNAINSLKENGMGGGYNFEILKSIPKEMRGTLPEGVDKLLTGESKILNRYTSQLGPGNKRYIFDKKTQNILGVGYHRKNGSSPGNADMKWLFKFY